MMMRLHQRQCKLLLSQLQAPTFNEAMYSNANVHYSEDCLHEMQPSTGFYIFRLSLMLPVYKSRLTALQLRDHSLDLLSPEMKTNIAFVRSRFGTNIFPSWELTQLMRNMNHNGEFNKLEFNKLCGCGNSFGYYTAMGPKTM